MKRWTTQPFSKAFTIIELLIVIAVIAILAIITVVGYSAVVNNAHDGSVKSDLQKIDDAFKQFALDSGGVYPDSYVELRSLGVKVSPDSYSLETKANIYVCLNPSATEYAVIAMSRSQKRFVLKSESGIGEYTGNVEWTSTDAQWNETCESIDPAYESPNEIAGIHDGQWLSWTGVDGSIAAITCPTGFVIVPGNATFGTDDFCVMKYEAKNNAGMTTSEAAGTPWVNISQTSAIAAAVDACSGCHLITEAEWLTTAHNVLNVASNWSGGSVGSGFIYSGHNDNSPANALAASTDDNDGYYGTGNSNSSGANQRRTLTLSNGEVIWDLSGNVNELTSGTSTGVASQPGLSSDGTGVTKEWNNSSLLMGDFANARPSFGTPAAASWTAASNGIGNLLSYYNDPTPRAFLRSGAWNATTVAGIFRLNSSSASTSYQSSTIGFRAAR